MIRRRYKSAFRLLPVAKAFDEETIYRAAGAFESGVNWKSPKAG